MTLDPLDPLDHVPRSSPRPGVKRVLLAEDDTALRHLLAETLRGNGYEVSEIPDGGRLLVRVAQEVQGRGVLDERRGSAPEPIDLIISDVRMPVCTGLQIVEALRQVHRKTPVILITAFADDATRAKAEGLGAVLFDKPVDLDELMEVVAQILSGERDPSRR